MQPKKLLPIVFATSLFITFAAILIVTVVIDDSDEAASYACVTEQPAADQATPTNDEPYVTTPTQEKPEVQVPTSIVGTWTTTIYVRTGGADITVTTPAEVTWTINSDGSADATYWMVSFIHEDGTEQRCGGASSFTWEQSDKVTPEGYVTFKLAHVTCASGGFYAHLLYHATLSFYDHHSMDEIYLWINEDTGKLHDGFMEFIKKY